MALRYEACIPTWETVEYEIRICKYCGREFEDFQNRTLCPECLHERLSSAQKKAIKESGDYSIQRWEDCLVDKDVMIKGRECALYLVQHFGENVDKKTLESLAMKLESNLNMLDEGSLDEEALMQSPIWKIHGQKYVTKVVEKHYDVSLSDTSKYPVLEDFWKKYSLIASLLKEYRPNALLLSKIIEHCKNSERCKDPLGFKKLMHANLSLAIVKDFDKKFKIYL